MSEDKTTTGQETLYRSKICYRIAAVLLFFYERGEEETLIPNIAAKANVSQGNVRRWIDKLARSGFVETIRYADRQDAICRTRQQILIKLTKNIPLLYLAMFLEKWEQDFIDDICPKNKETATVNTLRLVKKKAA